jgi:hypothetical protein
MRALGVVELKRAGERLEDEVGDAAEVSALQALVVLDADAGQRRHLLAAEAGHAPLAVGGQASLLRRHLRPPGGQELGDVAGGVHVPNRSRAQRVLGCPVSTPVTGPPTFAGSALS